MIKLFFKSFTPATKLNIKIKIINTHNQYND